MPVKAKRKFYIVMLSIHGLVRSENPELGRDADTGGQVLYVIELLKTLAQHDDIERVELMTRQIVDPRTDQIYSEPEEKVHEKAYIIRIPCGPRRYLHKETLWPYMDSFADQALQHIRKIGRVPDVIHGHYADAGYVGAQLSHILGVPFVFTGHSLGRVKKERLIRKGIKPESIEKKYKISQRIEAEEIALEAAARVVTSTRQEIEEQYAQYHNYHPEKMIVIPPSIDLSRFDPPGRGKFEPPVYKSIAPFLKHPKKPMILSISRLDERKNLLTLIEAYAGNEELQKMANLVIFAGSRGDIRKLDTPQRKVLLEILYAVDKYNLYGKVAYPKTLEPDDAPDLYRLAAYHHGAFVNPALTEPFGLTIIEAAASGLPVVATEHGGPRDILGLCENGFLVNPLEAEAIGEKILQLLSNRKGWRRFSRNGVRGVQQHYSWKGHVRKYIKEMKKLSKTRKSSYIIRHSGKRLVNADRIIFTDIDNTLIGDKKALKTFLKRLKEAELPVGFAVATGRSLEKTRSVLKDWRVPTPDILITSVGTEIYYGHPLVEDKSWISHIRYHWRPEAVRDALSEIPGLTLQPEEDQRKFKISYFMDPARAPKKQDIVKHLRQKGIVANVIHSHETLLDILPIRTKKGLAIRFLAMKWGIAPTHILVAGDSGNDEDMLVGNMLGVVVGNYSPEVGRLKGKPRIYFAGMEFADGIIEGIDYYNFFGDIRLPEEEDAQRP